MSIEQIIITAITAAAFVGMGIYLVTKGRKIQYPTGTRRVVNIRGIEVIAIFEREYPTATQDRYLQHLAKALDICGNIWLRYTPWHGAIGKDYPKLVVHYAIKVNKDLHGVQTYAKAKIGKRSIPMLVVEDIHGTLMRSTGLVIHEVGHLLAVVREGHPDKDHLEDMIWAELSAESFEAEAQNTYAERVRQELP